MGFFALLMIALGLAMDCFAVSLGIGTAKTCKSFRPFFRLCFHFGLFQGGMTLLGYLAGNTIAPLIESVDHWIAMALLAFVGIRMIREGVNPNAETYCNDPSKGGMLIMLAVATSIDALAVGLSFAFLQVKIVPASLIIGITSTVLSILGLTIGHGLGTAFGKRMEIIGGLILNGIGLNIIISHLF